MSEFGYSEKVFQRILGELRRRRGLDFNCYRSTFLHRRMEARLISFGLGADDYAAYEKILASHPEEWDKLFDSLTINVAEFFRDPAVWRYLAGRVLTPLVRDGDRPVRIWSAGCASGEEPYTISILVHEILRLMSRRPDVQILATDVDPMALEGAKAGVYKKNVLEQVSSQRLKIFFKRLQDDAYAVNADVKALVRFQEHNYLTPPTAFSQMDLVCCRNSMIYLNPEARNTALSHFHTALAPRGVLMLGATEVLLGELQKFQFEVISEQPGIFRKLS